MYRDRVGQAEQLLRGAQVGLHHALDQARHALAHVLQPALGGLGQGHQPAHLLGSTLRRLRHLVAHGFKGLRRVLGDLALAFGHHLRGPAHGLVRGHPGAAHGVHPGLGALARDIRGGLRAAAQRVTGGTAALLRRFGALLGRIADGVHAGCHGGSGRLAVLLDVLGLVLRHFATPWAKTRARFVRRTTARCAETCQQKSKLSVRLVVSQKLNDMLFCIATPFRELSFYNGCMLSNKLRRAKRAFLK